MRIYILGICGTFMAGVARLATERGHQVGGADANIYPPMSTQLQSLGTDLHQGYDPAHIANWKPDLIIIGNALSRGNPSVEAVLNSGTRFVSGPQWIYEEILRDRWVLAIAGTHGKTTTSSLVCWLLEHAGLEPGFLIGGVPENFGVSARLGSGPFFVIEADEYDAAFFDKRSKFVHYHPKTLVLNNLEYDHADIFDNLGEIKKQFHHLVRIVPGQGLVVVNRDDHNLAQVMDQGCWSEQQGFSVTQSADWTARGTSKDFSRFDICKSDDTRGDETPGGETRVGVQSPLIGSFNMSNTLAAVAAVHHAGVPLDQACRGVAGFKSVKRRLQLLATVGGVSIYDDFAHHPTAIEQTLRALRQRVGERRVICVLELRSNTMLLGKHSSTLGDSLRWADRTIILEPRGAQWDMASLANQKISILGSVPEIIQCLADSVAIGDHVVVMSNGSFDNIHQKLIEALSVRL